MIQGFADKAQLSDILYAIKERRYYIFALAILAAVGTIVNHILYVPSYVAPARIELLTRQQNLMSHVGSPDMQAFAAEQNQAQEMSRRISHLRSESFYLEVAKRVINSKEYPKLNLTVTGDLSIWHSKFWRTRFRKRTKTDDKEEEFKTTQMGTSDPGFISEIAGLVQGFTTVSSDDSQWITISVKTYDPATSMFLANLEAETYLSVASADELNEINDLLKFLQDRINEIRAQIKLDEDDLVAFKKKHNIFSTEETDKSYSSSYREIETQASALRLKISENNNLMKLLVQKMTHVPKSSTRIEPYSSSRFPRELSLQLDNLRRQKYLMTTQGSPADPAKLEELNAEIANLSKQLKAQISAGSKFKPEEFPMSTSTIEARISELTNQNSLAKAHLDALEAAKADLVDSVAQVPKIEQELFSKMENLKMEYELFSSLKKKLQDSEIQKLAIRPPIRIDGTSRAAPQEVRLSILIRLLFSMIVGSFIGAVLVLVLETGNTTIRHATDLEALDLTLLGNIPHIESKVGAFLKANEVNTDLLVCETRPNSPEAMAFKYVREQLKVLLTHRGKPIKSITISGTQQHEGKTFFASNLAVAMARLDKRVLLVDCDIRAPRVARYFGLENSAGLTTLLETPNSDLTDYLVHERIKSLDILPSGPSTPNPTELFGGQRFKAFLMEAADLYDYIFLDAPPAGYVADAPIIAGISDAVILVTSYRKTTKRSLLMAHRKIFQISHRRAYGILNNVPGSAHEFTPYLASASDVANIRKGA